MQATSSSAAAALAIPSASFFPTTNEISVSLRWFRENPVMAAATCAAATAVSMAAYFAMQPKDSVDSGIPFATDDFHDPTLVKHKASRRHESDASDKPTEKDSTLSLSSMAGELYNTEHLIPLDSVPEKGVYPNYDECDIQSPEWGWYVSTTPPADEMYVPYAYKAD
ncbi:Aste57867_18724 [Aphanomyces stellatus]|uniref:Aste57867_18724 protein n=1 Tax=Aphanomyces stellatus TaxID=120398 RepID=A0A485LAV9_9STRA|nr:hypothetical protein As57867_018660 [Aphanomyces stellatus]VFT95458.1 Aste57867_18724 [Aphanomyces stellatus]